MQIDYRLHFKAIDVEVYTDTLLDKFINGPNLNKVIEEMIFDLSEKKEFTQFEDYYKQYNQIIEFNRFLEISKKDCEKELNNSRHNLNAHDSDLSLIKEYYLQYKYGGFFKEVWFTRPKIQVSPKLANALFDFEFFQNYIDGETSLQEYDSAQTTVIKKIYPDDNSLFDRPILISAESANQLQIYLRNSVLSKKLTLNEIDMLNTILQKASDKKIYLFVIIDLW